MPLSFQNAYTETAYVALLLFDSGCSPDPWSKSGWYRIEPNQTVEIFGTDLRTLPTPNWAWFADTGADGPSWSGDHWYRVPHNAAFNKCYDDDTDCNAVWAFRAVTFSPDWSGFTIVLMGPGAADRGEQGCAWGIPEYPPPPPRHDDHDDSPWSSHHDAPYDDSPYDDSPYDDSPYDDSPYDDSPFDDGDDG
ncbi:MAG TPA: hypothetical protein VK781_01955 [Solirubrobacteraceae bacterium]|jgi:hypothetical protein|nr:hypothetical protein [Solirubrobacteraceae bacterium]